MAAYYNELDPFAAAWLRNLIAAGHIAPGEVDERSILEVRPDDLRGFTQCHFFAGIGVWSYAMRSAGWADDRPVWTGSCPCQPFSSAGKGNEFADERHLWPAWFRLIRECRPVAVFGEQVASKDALAWLDHVSTDLEGEGYAVGAVDTCAAGFGAPHIRQRLYFVADCTIDGRGEGLPHIGWSDARDRAQGLGAGLDSGRATSVLADSDARRRGERGERDSDPAQPGEFPSRRDDAGGRSIVGDTAAAGLPDGDGEGDRPARQRDAEPQRPSEPSLMVNAEQPRLERLPGHGDNGHGPGRDGARAPGSTAAASEPCATNGFWTNADWTPCRDGKARPVEPGSSPLAYGAPNRVGRLRGYGNAICAPQAREFVMAFMEIAL